MRARQACRARMLTALLIVGMVAFGIMLIPLFSIIDCYQVERYAAAYEYCLNSADCEIQDRHRFAYKRAQYDIARCRTR